MDRPGTHARTIDRDSKRRIMLRVQRQVQSLDERWTVVWRINPVARTVESIGNVWQLERPVCDRMDAVRRIGAVNTPLVRTQATRNSRDRGRFRPVRASI